MRALLVGFCAMRSCSTLQWVYTYTQLSIHTAQYAHSAPVYIAYSTQQTHIYSIMYTVQIHIAKYTNKIGRKCKHTIYSMYIRQLLLYVVYRGVEGFFALQVGDRRSRTSRDHKGRPKFFFSRYIPGSIWVENWEISGSIWVKFIELIDINNIKWIELLDMKIFFRDKIPESKACLRHILVDIKGFVYFSYIQNRHSQNGSYRFEVKTSPLTSQYTTAIL